jgi:hypothetical protein
MSSICSLPFLISLRKKHSSERNALASGGSWQRAQRYNDDQAAEKVCAAFGMAVQLSLEGCNVQRLGNPV